VESRLMDRAKRSWTTAWSVTRVLATRYGDAFFVPSAALKRGLAIHEWTQSYDEGGVVHPSPEIKGWCDAYTTFFHQMSPSWTHIEHPVEHGDLGYHGFIDRVGYLGQGIVVADIKTGSPRKTDALQLAAYTLAMYPRTYRAVPRVGIYITKDGTWKTITYSDMGDFVLWNQILEEALHGKRHTRSDSNRGRSPNHGHRELGEKSSDPDGAALQNGVRLSANTRPDAAGNPTTLRENQKTHQRRQEKDS
jgi:hypothetical protein